MHKDYEADEGGDKPPEEVLIWGKNGPYLLRKGVDMTYIKSMVPKGEYKPGSEQGEEEVRDYSETAKAGARDAVDEVKWKN